MLVKTTFDKKRYQLSIGDLCISDGDQILYLFLGSLFASRYLFLSPECDTAVAIGDHIVSEQFKIVSRIEE